MSQNSLILPTTGTVSGLQMTQDVNNAIDTLNTLSSGASAPGGTEAGQIWHDTANNILKLRSLDNSQWIVLFNLNETNYSASFAQQATGNRIRNGGMVVWQRGTGGGVVTAGTPAYTADGFIVGCAGANVAWAQGGGIVNTQHSLLITGNTGVTDTFVKQRIEAVDCSLFNNVTVTVQARIANGTGATLTPTLTVKHATATDNWSATATDVSAVSLQTIANNTNAVVAYSYVSPSAASINGIEVTFDFGATLNSNTKIINISEIDIRLTPNVITGGLNGNPPFVELRPVANELALCQRHFFQLTASTNIVIGLGFAYASNGFEIGIPLPIPMRAVPTASLPTASNVQANGIAAVTLIASNNDAPSANLFTLSGTVASGIASGIGVGLRWAGTSGIIQLSAEL